MKSILYLKGESWEENKTTAITVAGNSLEYRRTKYDRAVGEYTERNTSIQNLKAQTCTPPHGNFALLEPCTKLPTWRQILPHNMQLGTAIMNQE